MGKVAKSDELAFSDLGLNWDPNLPPSEGDRNLSPAAHAV